MKKIKRFKMTDQKIKRYTRLYNEMIGYDTGEYVLYADYLKLQDEREMYRRHYRDWKENCDAMAKQAFKFKIKALSLESKLNSYLNSDEAWQKEREGAASEQIISELQSKLDKSIEYINSFAGYVNADEIESIIAELKEGK